MKKNLFLILSLFALLGCNMRNSSSNSLNNSLSSSDVQSSSNTGDNTSQSQTSENISNSNVNSQSSIQKQQGYIYDENDLINIKNDLSQNYYLANDIKLTKEWQTIGDDDNPFSGTLDGNGYSIQNLNIKSSLSITQKTVTSGVDYSSVGGLFGKVTGTVKNLKVVNYNISLSNQTINKNVNASNSEYKIFIGGIAGINKGTIINCEVNGSINVGSNHLISRGRLGGLVGKNDGTIEHCKSSGQITSTFAYENVRAGGLIGATEGGVTKKSWSSTSINATNTNGKAIVGGLIGLVEFSTVEDCYATGIVEAKSNKAATAGGVVGLIDATMAGKTIISRCYSESKITTTATERSSYSGGVVGNCEVLISGSGLIGEVTISNCFYIGSGIYSTARNKAHGGMIISCIEGNSNYHTITISNCLYIPKLTISVKGTVESKKNAQGTEVASLQEIYNKIKLDDNIWEYDSTSDKAPILK